MSFMTGNKQAESGGGSFLPADYVQRKAERRNNIIIGLLFIVVLGALGAGFAVNNQRKLRLKDAYFDVRAQCEEQSKQIEQLRALQEQRSAMMEKASITAALVERLPRWALLAEITYRLPTTARLTGLEVKANRQQPQAAPVVPVPTMSDDPNAQPPKPRVLPPTFTYDLVIAGTADDNKAVADFLTSLKGSPALRNVELSFIRDTREGDTLVRQFEFTAKLRSRVSQADLKNSIDALIAKATGGDHATDETAPAGEAQVDATATTLDPALQRAVDNIVDNLPPAFGNEFPGAESVPDGAPASDGPGR